MSELYVYPEDDECNTIKNKIEQIDNQKINKESNSKIIENKSIILENKEEEKITKYSKDLINGIFEKIFDPND